MKNLLFWIPVLFMFSCGKEPTITKNSTYQYLHISHTRTQANPSMDAEAEQIDYSLFDMLWLGGDMALLTSLDDSTMTYVDSFFNFSDPNTLWALGNHDYSDLNRVQSFTNRPPYYSYHKNNITFIVLDTQDSLSSIVGAQMELVNNVLDTIEYSSHVVLLHHKLIWMYGDSALQPLISTTANGTLGSCFYCINPNNFYTAVYPKLKDVKQKGIEVLCIGGDLGFKVAQFEYTTADGIHFLGSGVESGKTMDNRVLLFSHDVNAKELVWEFKLLSDL